MKKFKFNHGITAKWAKSTLLLISVFLLVVLTVTAVIIGHSYRDTVETTLKNAAFSTVVGNFFPQTVLEDDEKFRERAVAYLEETDLSGKIEIHVINGDGKIIASNTGFDVAGDKTQDYYTAVKSGEPTFFLGENAFGEKIMSLTNIIGTDVNGKNVAVSYVVSVESVNTQLLRIIILFAFILLLTVLFVGISGLFFIRSIVRPLEQVNEKAKQIAAGDYKTKITVKEKYSYELKDLCHTFNLMAEAISESDKLKNDFISTVSHEMRTPMTTIKGWAETVQQSDDPETIEKGIDFIVRESESLNCIVEDLLDFSRLESGRLHLEKKRIDGLAELAEITYMFENRARDKGLELIYEDNDSVAPIYADSVRIRQVFTNIIDNALKYTERGTITVKSIVDDKNFIAIVEDTGCGISDNLLPYIKEKFFKANMSHGGAGIGLAVCDEIIKQHDGKMEISSVVGEGTLVRVTFPLSD